MRAALKRENDLNLNRRSFLRASTVAAGRFVGFAVSRFSRIRAGRNDRRRRRRSIRRMRSYTSDLMARF